MTERSSALSSHARKPQSNGVAGSVFLDANALLLPIRSRFPLEAEIDRLCPGGVVTVPSSVVGELDRLAARGVSGARGALALARRFPSVVVAGRGDRAILEAAVLHRSCVVTADRELAERLGTRGIDVLVPRDRHRLELRRGRRPAPATRRAVTRR